jgi:chemotaxis protein MotB
MALLSRHTRRPSIDIWPGFVDALSQLLMVIIFLLLVFTAGQVYLSQALSGRNKLLDRLEKQINALGDMLSLERHANADLRLGTRELSGQLSSALEARDRLQREVAALAASQKESAKEISALALSKHTLEENLASAENALSLAQQKVASRNLQIAGLEKRSGKAATALSAEKKLNQEALLKIEALGAEIAALREQLATVAAALDLAQTKAKSEAAKIADLGQRLNLALVKKVDALALYRSEFFGKLRKIIGNQPDIHIVGDRFVFAASVLFASGSATLTPSAKTTLRPVFAALKQIAAKIPPHIHWILQVDGFTDAAPISTPEFPSNWELSAERAIAVVRYAVENGISRDHVAAEGYGDTHPLDPGDTPQAYRKNRRIELRLSQR